MPHPLYAVIFALVQLVILSTGITLVYRAHMKYDSQPCILVNITDFHCVFSMWAPFKNLNYYAVTSMIMLMSNATIFAEVSNYCFTCAGCQDTYQIGSYYDCVSIGSKYTIRQYMDGISTIYMTMGGIILISIAIAMGLTIPILIIRYGKCRVKSGYQELS